MLDVSDDVRAEIGDDEADRLIAGGSAPDIYDCTSCRAPGDVTAEPTSTVLFVAEETAVLAFAHARCIPSQVVPVDEAQLRGAVQGLTGNPDQPVEQVPLGEAGGYGYEQQPDPRTYEDPRYSMAGVDRGGAAHGGPQSAPAPNSGGWEASYGSGVPGHPSAAPAGSQHMPQQQAAPPQPAAPAPRAPEPDTAAVLSVTCGLVLVQDPQRGALPRAALVVEPTGPVSRPGPGSGRDEFFDLLLESGMHPVQSVEHAPGPLPGWSVLLAMGRLHAVLQPGPQGGTTAWWQAHQPLQVTDAWRAAAVQQREVLLYAAPHGHIGQQPREDLMRSALDQAAARGVLAGAVLPLAGT